MQRHLEEPPLIVDLDGALLRSSLTAEAGMTCLKSHPHHLPKLLRLLALRERGSGSTPPGDGIDVSVLPYSRTVVDFIEQQDRDGRSIVLVSAQPRALVEQVAANFALFDQVLTVDGHGKSATRAKLELLTGTYGAGGFDYVGDCGRDASLFEAARGTYLVGIPAEVHAQQQRLRNVCGTLQVQQASLRDWLKALRLHQWLKNLLLLVPLFAAHRYTEPVLLIAAIEAFVAFGLCASSVYVLNDLLDLRDDRHHARKRHRPFASGRLSIGSGLAACVLLLLVAFLLAAACLSAGFVAVLATYYALTLTYSLTLKRRMVFDVMALAALYTLRIVAGAVGLAIPLSFWLLALSMFMFLSLALVKRYAELFQARASGMEEKTRGRGYYPSDLQMIAALGAASGYMAVMILALYINDAHTTQMYRHVEVIWLACPLLLTWISRMWMLTHRGHMNDDPVLFAIKDRISLVLGALIGVVFWLAA